MSDLIDRQAAIDLWVWGDTDKWRDSKVVHIEDIEALPSARKKGKWINAGIGCIRCSECGLKTTRVTLIGLSPYGKSEPNFCPNCGADMRGGDAI